MTNKEKAEKLNDLLKDQDLLKISKVDDVNHKPHPFTIGAKHLKENRTYLTKEIAINIGCAHPDCELSYEEHTSDNAAFIQLLRNGTHKERVNIFKKLLGNIGEDFVDGFVFIETEEKFRIGEQD